MNDRIEYLANKRGVFITENGVFIGLKGKEIGSIDKSGYLFYSMRIDGKHKKLFAHRLQAFQKHGSKLYEPGIVTRHLDGIRLNNSRSNIAIGTHSDNMMDIPEQDRISKAKYAASFLKVHDSDKIKEFYMDCRSYVMTMKEFGISSKGTLHFILNGRNNNDKKIA